MLTSLLCTQVGKSMGVVLYNSYPPDPQQDPQYYSHPSLLLAVLCTGNATICSLEKSVD